MNLLEINEQQINQVVRVYEGKRRLTVLEGMRQTLPASAYPSFEIEPGSGANRWATTRAQRPRFSFACTLTVSNSREKLGVEYITTLATILTEIMCSPNNLQMRVLNETKWDANSGLQDTYILDSLVEDVSYSASRDGTMRVAEFSWFAEIHEPFPEAKWEIGSSTTPSVVRPVVVTT
jgi:hypothetical protein